jgi:hypothetical protein
MACLRYGAGFSGSGLRVVAVFIFILSLSDDRPER